LTSPRRGINERATLLVAAIVVATIFATSTAASGPPLTPLRALCTAAGGNFFLSLDRQRVVCDSPLGVRFTDQQLNSARLLCTHAYGALFSVSGGTEIQIWNCFFGPAGPPGGE
jgi:hypothetical protein